MEYLDWLDRRSAELDAEYAKALDKVRECQSLELEEMGHALTSTTGMYDPARLEAAETLVHIARESAARLASTRAGFALYVPILRDRYTTGEPDGRCLLCTDPAAERHVRLCAEHIGAWCDLCGYRIAAQPPLCDDCRARALEGIETD